MACDKSAALLAAVAMTMAAGGASAASKCDIVGTFKDSLGSTGKFTSEKKGTVTNTTICPKPYALTVTDLTLTVIDVKGKSTDKSCGALTGDFNFQNGGCTSAAGTVTIAGLGSFPDTITKTSSVSHRPAADTSLLSNGLK